MRGNVLSLLRAALILASLASGTASAAPTASPDHQAAPTPEVTIPQPPGPAGSVRPRDSYPNGGALLEQSLYSRALSQDISYWIFLPPGYDASARRYPVVYMLHGLDADSEQWPAFGLTGTADELIADGDIQPLLIVLPFGWNSYFLNDPRDGLRWADHITTEVVGDVDRRYRTVARARSRAIGGLSMGGDAALRFALTFPELFGVSGAHSPSTRFSYDEAPEGLFADEEAFNRANPLWLITHTRVARKLKVWLDVGEDDPWLLNVRAIHELLEEQGVEHELHIYEGEHGDEYWSDHVADYLRFYSAALESR